MQGVDDMSKSKEPMKFDADARPKYRRPLADILGDLRREIPPSLLKAKTIKGTAITYIPWHKVVDVLDWFAPGWSQEIRSVSGSGAQTIIVMRLTIPAAEGDFYREAAGIETEEVSGYGDTSSNASAMALRRSAAMFGVGKYLYCK
jgi:hypothetical protein